ncbi:hypothetical protein [Dactylosporangium sp. NPDC050588]|uniref:hypothetical protein n=1 Tax=Dactylosporangium sp. NPDC050588 TaxID=3157211 RepID=UPI0033E01992
MLVVLALWVHDRGVQDLAGPAAGLSSLGRLTGLISADLLLIQVLLMFKDELDAAVAAGRLRVGFLVGPRSREGSWVPAGFRDDQLSRWVPGLHDHHVYVCGPDAWMSAAAAAVLRAGVPPRRLHTERFSW